MNKNLVMSKNVMVDFSERFENVRGDLKYFVGDTVLDTISGEEKIIKTVDKDNGFVFEDGKTASASSFPIFNIVKRGEAYNNLFSLEDFEIKDGVLYICGNPIEMGDIEAFDIVKVKNEYGSGKVLLISRNKKYEKKAFCWYDIENDNFHLDPCLLKFDDYEIKSLKYNNDIITYVFVSSNKEVSLTLDKLKGLKDYNGKFYFDREERIEKFIANSSYNEEENTVTFPYKEKTFCLVGGNNVLNYPVSIDDSLDNFKIDLKCVKDKDDYLSEGLEEKLIYKIHFQFFSKDSLGIYDPETNEILSFNFNFEEIQNKYDDIYFELISYSNKSYYEVSTCIRKTFFTTNENPIEDVYWVYCNYSDEDQCVLLSNDYLLYSNYPYSEKRIYDKKALKLIKDKYKRFIKLYADGKNRYSFIFANDQYETIEVIVEKTKDRGFVTTINK